MPKRCASRERLASGCCASSTNSVRSDIRELSFQAMAGLLHEGTSRPEYGESVTHVSEHLLPMSPLSTVGEGWGGGRDSHPPPPPSPTRGAGERQGDSDGRTAREAQAFDRLAAERPARKAAG